MWPEGKHKLKLSEEPARGRERGTHVLQSLRLTQIVMLLNHKMAELHHLVLVTFSNKPNINIVEMYDIPCTKHQAVICDGWKVPRGWGGTGGRWEYSGSAQLCASQSQERSLTTACLGLQLI